MMWPEGIKKRICKYLLEHYLGNFLQEKLRLDQLNVDLYNGRGFVENVMLDIYTINEILQSVHAPIEVLKGSVGSISVSIPWTKIMSESCIVEVKGLNMVAQPMYRANVDLADITGSFYSSLKSMTTSMQLAQDGLQGQEKKESNGQYDGLNMWTNTIESVLRRIKVKFCDITVCFEHSSQTTSGIGLELSVSQFEYFDEDSEKSSATTARFQDKDVPIFEDITFTCKQFRVSGVHLSLYQFHDTNNVGGFPSMAPKSENLMLNPVLIAQCFGEQQIKLRVKEKEQISGPKVDAEFYLGSCCTFLTPKQVHLLLEFIEGFTNPTHAESNYTADSFPSSASPSVATNKPMTFEDFRHIEGQLTGNDFQTSHYCECDDVSSLSLDGGGKSVQFHSMADVMPIRNNYREKSETGRLSPQSLASTQLTYENDGLNVQQHHEKCNPIGADGGSKDAFRLQINMRALSLTILHVDPMDVMQFSEEDCKFSANKDTEALGKGSPVDGGTFGSNHETFVSKYFEKVRKLFENNFLEDLFKRHSYFTNDGFKYDHLRILAGPLHIECERHTHNPPSLSSSNTKIDASVGALDFVECLHNDSRDKSGSKFTFVDLLVFPDSTENKAQSMHTSSYKEHVVKLKVELTDSCVVTQTSIDLYLASCKSEVDISIVDRLNALFYSANLKSQVHSAVQHSNAYPAVNEQMLNKQAYFQRALDDEHEAKLNKLDFKISSPQMHIEFRFPIPDLRPEIQKRPWFKRSLRSEVLHLTAKDFVGCTNISFTDDLDKMTEERKVIKVRFRDMSASYSDETDKPAKLFLQTCQKESDSSESSESDYDWPLIEIHLQENKNANQLGCSEENNMRSDEMNMFTENSQHHFSLSEDHDTYLSNDFPMFNSLYEQPANRIPSPFSQRKVRYDNEEMILPGDEQEIQDFIDHATSTAKINLTLSFPVVQVNVPSKSFIESIYNRINNDLLLWEPVAPQPAQLTTDESNTSHIPLKLDIASQFFTAQGGFQDLSKNNARKSDLHVSFLTDDDNETSIISKASTGNNKPVNQSFLSLSLAISHGSVSMCSTVPSDEDPPQTGLIYFILENGSLFSVSRYHSNPNVDYACIQVDSCSIHHRVGLLSVPVMEETRCLPTVPPTLNPIIYPSEESVNQAFGHRKMSVGQSSGNQKMVTIVVKVELEEKRCTKQCVVASQIQGVTMRHQFLPSGHYWLEQLLDIFDIQDAPVLGYEPPSFLTEVHFHLKECALDYKPLHLSSRAIATLHSFALSSNVVANSPLSILQIVMDNVFLYISDNSTSSCVDLQRNFVNVLDVSLLELCLKLTNQSQPSHSGDLKHPLVELIVSNNQFEMRTCADSFSTFAALLRYIAADGDIVLSENYHQQSKSGTNSDSATSQTPELTSEEKEFNARLEKQHQLDMEKELSSLMEDAMKDVLVNDETESPIASTFSSNGKASITSNSFSGDLHQTEVNDFAMPDDDDDDFCIIADPNLQSYKDYEPEVEYLVKEQGTKVTVIDNHFTPVFGKADILRAPDHFPVPVMRYVVRELSCSWYMYGGNDFTTKKSSSKQGLMRRNLSKEKALYESPKLKPSDYLKSPHHSNRKVGGFNRNYKVLMEFHLMKVRFQHDAFKPEDEYVSRTVFTITDFEIRDRLDSSQINKFLYHYHNEASPKQSHANMLLIKALLIKPAPDKAPECRLKVSLQPLRLNVDQDSLMFMTDFFTSLSNSITEDATLPSDNRSSTFDTNSSAMADPQLEFEPSLKMGNSSSASFNTVKNEESSQIPFQPLFFREFIFSPDVPILLDYRGKHIDIEQGKLAGLLMGLGQLNFSQLKLRKIVYRHGLLGADRVVNFALNTWAADIRNNQLSSILGGVGPLHSVVQFFQGVRDLVWLPVEQYRRDGRIVKGLQRGTSSFGTSTSMAVLEITNRLVWLVQTTAETACDIVSPVEFQRNKERQRNTWHGLEKHARLKRQPTDLREGFINAVTVVQHGVTDTASSLARVAQKEHERQGIVGAAGGVIRHIPLTLVCPVAIASEATSNILSGMRNQILPDAKREDEDKWRNSAHNA